MCDYRAMKAKEKEKEREDRGGDELYAFQAKKVLRSLSLCPDEIKLVLFTLRACACACTFAVPSASA